MTSEGVLFIVAVTAFTTKHPLLVDLMKYVPLIAIKDGPLRELVAPKSFQ